MVTRYGGTIAGNGGQQVRLAGPQTGHKYGVVIVEVAKETQEV